ncbi:hypothetical protein [Actinoplanes sp. RD1]|uniref:hypothetical protein n=1 Tax=Actinoplanes sp. RD1 TaxID=3064538 RepID=UPI0027409A0E|nr:hypothetical protein [Actinoplanes sp. RD1]
MNGTATLAIKTVALLAVAGGAAVLHETPAAASCAHGARDANAGYDTVEGTGGQGLALRIGGPHTSCSYLYRIPDGTQIDLYCWTQGDNIFGTPYWNYVRWNQGDGTGDRFGWVSIYYLRNAGAPSWAAC